MDFDNRKVYGDTSITDGLVLDAKMKSYFYFYYKAGILGVLFSYGHFAKAVH